MARAWLPAAALLLLPAMRCDSTARKVTEGDAARLEIGKTTRKEVVALIGLPGKIEHRTAEDGTAVELWLYFIKPDRELILTGSPVFTIGINRMKRPRADVALIVAFAGSDVVADAGLPPEKP